MSTEFDTSATLFNELGAVENWRPVVDYPDYEVSDMGRVRCLKDRKGGHKAPFFPAISLSKAARPIVTLRNDIGQKVRRVDELVLETFVGPRPAPDHGPAPINGDRQDVRADNLAWAGGIARVVRPKGKPVKRRKPAKKTSPVVNVAKEIRHGHWLGMGNVMVSIQPNGVVELTVAEAEDHHSIPVSDLDDAIRVLQAAKTIIDG